MPYAGRHRFHPVAAAAAGAAPPQRTAAAMLDLLVTNATLPDGRTGMSVAVQGGKITEVTSGLQAPAQETVDAKGYLLTPPLCDPHFHMDATLSYGLPRINESGTLLEGI